MKPETKALLDRAGDDEQTLSFAGLPDVPFGYHTEQAIEKYLKALLNELIGSFPYTHDLKTLVSKLVETGEPVPQVAISLALITKYASHYRYDDMEDVSPLKRTECIEAVVTIRDYVLARIAQICGV